MLRRDFDDAMDLLQEQAQKLHIAAQDNVVTYDAWTPD